MKKKEKIRIFFLLFFAILFLFSAINLIAWHKENKKVKKITEEEKKRIKVKNREKYLDTNILKDNEDTIGWIIVDGTNINYPVVQSDDNEYYLTHDFKKKENSAGWIFMDYQNKWSDQNIVIYGHHRKDGSMFGSIDKLFDNNTKNITITFITTKTSIKYQVFSIYKISSKDNYIEKNFNNLDNMINKFIKRSEINFQQNIYHTDQIITLSTCHNNNIDRIVVHGYKKNIKNLSK